MTSKGPLWTILFFLILTYIITTTVQTPDKNLDGDLKLESAGKTMKVATREADARLIPEGKDAIAFTVGKPGTLTIPPPQDEKPALYKEQDGELHPIELEETRDPYATTPLMETRLEPGNYIITAPRNPEGTSNLDKAFGIAILLDILLIVFANHHHRRRQRHHHEAPGEEQAEIYARKALMAGQQEQAIKTQLLKAGWPTKRVDHILQRVRFF
ncbi:MAG: hypothetical protein ACLFO2_03265 [Candidatus Woesearchaeota archaeon]